MKISEILELTKTRPIAEIAKTELEISEKTARKALQRAGCYSVVGRAGWFLDDTENPENLEQSIYYFAEQAKLEEKEMLKAAANVQTYKPTHSRVLRKRHSFDLDVRLVKELKLKSVQNDITLYEAVEKAIRLYLAQDKEDGPLS